MNKCPRYIVQWDDQPTHFCKTMCSLLESQILVDITVTCGSYSLRVHKCVLAASSPYLRRQLQREPFVDKIMMNDVKHTVLKAIVEFMYCGETSIYEDSIHELITLANMLELRGLRAILPQKLGVVYDESKAMIQIKPPMFFCRGERVRDLDNRKSLVDQVAHASGAYDQVVDEARVALAKEEAASRHALQMLQNDLTTNLFVIEDACTEATVETSLTTTTATGQTAPVVSNACYVDVTGDLLTSLAGLQHHGHHTEQQVSVQEAPMTLKQLVAETVSDQDYSQTMEQPVNAPYASFIVDPRTLENTGLESSDSRHTISSSSMYIPGTPIVKRRRGRPRKVKVEDLSIPGNDEPHNLTFQTTELPHLIELSDEIKEENGDQNQPIHMEIIDDDDKNTMESSPDRKRTSRTNGNKIVSNFLE